MRRILLSTAKILISAALLYLALRKVDLTELLSRFTVTSLFWIGVAIAITFLQIFIGVLRWRRSAPNAARRSSSSGPCATT